MLYIYIYMCVRVCVCVCVCVLERYNTDVSDSMIHTFFVKFGFYLII